MNARAAVVVTCLATALLWVGCGRGQATGDIEALLQQSWQAYAMGDFDFALDTFHRVEQRTDATPEERFSALLGLATTYQLSTSPDLGKAAEYYGQLETLQTDGAREQGMLGLALVAAAQGRSADAQNGLTQLIGEFPDSVLADEAVLHLANSLLNPTRGSETGDFNLPREAQVDRAIRILEERLASHPANPLAAQMHIMVASEYIDGSQFQKAVDHLVAAEELGIQVSKTRSVVLWQIARIAERELKDYALAERFYALYVQDFPQTELFYRATKSLERVRGLEPKAEG